jgi:hypothetical protein
MEAVSGAALCSSSQVALGPRSYSSATADAQVDRDRQAAANPLRLHSFDCCAILDREAHQRCAILHP